MHHLQPTSVRGFQPIAVSGFYFCYHLETKYVRTSKLLLRSWKGEHTSGRDIDLLMEYPCQIPSSHPTKDTGCIRRPGSEADRRSRLGQDDIDGLGLLSICGKSARYEG